MINLEDLQAKSDQMNAVDFINPIIFRIKKVEYFPKQQQCIFLHLEGCDGRPYKPCKSMLRGIAQAWGDDETKWANNLLELYCEPSVMWAGKETGGIRISAISGISEPFEFPVQLNRKQRIMCTWNVLEDNQEVKNEFILTHYEHSIGEAENLNQIDLILKQVRADFGDEAMTSLKDATIAARAKFAPVEA